MIHSFLGTWSAWTAITKSRCATVSIILAFVVGLYASCVRSDAAVVTASGFVLKLNGKPFAAKA